MTARTGSKTKRRLVWLRPEKDAEVIAAAERQGQKVSVWIGAAIEDKLAAQRRWEEFEKRQQKIPGVDR